MRSNLAPYAATLRNAASSFGRDAFRFVSDLRLAVHAYAEAASIPVPKVKGPADGMIPSPADARASVVLAAIDASVEPTRARIRALALALAAYDAAIAKAADKRPAKLLNPKVGGFEPAHPVLRRIPCGALDWQTQQVIGTDPYAWVRALEFERMRDEKRAARKKRQ